MNDSLSHVAVCVECRRIAEPPLTRLFDPYGLPTNHFVCLECAEAIRNDERADETE